MAFPTGNFLKAELDISTKLSNLEERASKLEQEFSGIMSVAREIADVVKRYVDKTETETRSWEILESIMESNEKVRDILDHVNIFFNFMLAKMASRHAEITDVKMLWHLVENEGVKQVFHDVIKSFGFKADEADDIKLLLAVTCKLHVDMEREVQMNDHADACDVENQELCEKKGYMENNIPGDKIDRPNFDVSENTEIGNLSNISADETTLMDYTSLPTDVNDEVSSAVLSWNVEDSVKNVARRMIAIVLYTLNVGRAEKDLSIVLK